MTYTRMGKRGSTLGSLVARIKAVCRRNIAVRYPPLPPLTHPVPSRQGGGRWFEPSIAHQPSSRDSLGRHGLRSEVVRTSVALWICAQPAGSPRLPSHVRRRGQVVTGRRIASARSVDQRPRLAQSVTPRSECVLLLAGRPSFADPATLAYRPRIRASEQRHARSLDHCQRGRSVLRPSTSALIEQSLPGVGAASGLTSR